MPAICRPNGSDIGLPLSEREVSLREVNGLSSASLRASIRSLLLRSFNRRFARIADYEPADMGFQEIV